MELGSELHRLKGCFPLQFIFKNALPTSAQSVKLKLGKFLRTHVIERMIVDHVLGSAPTKKLQKVNPALVIRALEPGKQLIANMGTVTGLTLMPRTCVVHIDVTRYL